MSYIILCWWSVFSWFVEPVVVSSVLLCNVLDLEKHGQHYVRDVASPEVEHTASPWRLTVGGVYGPAVPRKASAEASQTMGSKQE